MLEQNFDWKAYGCFIEARNPIYWYHPSLQSYDAVGLLLGVRMTTLKSMLPCWLRTKLWDYHMVELLGMKWKMSTKSALNAKPRCTDASLMKSIFKKFNAISLIIGYLSLDVEGAEQFIVMNNFPLEKYKLKVLASKCPKDQLLALLKSNGCKKLLDFRVAIVSGPSPVSHVCLCHRLVPVLLVGYFPPIHLLHLLRSLSSFDLLRRTSNPQIC